METFYSNGKLFILGEYYVLEGAKVFALPTKFGQYLHVTKNSDATIHWVSYDADATVWYQESFTVYDVLQRKQTFANHVSNTLIDILYHAHQLNPEILKNGWTVETKLTFPRNWGLGSSSTLINNIAQWFAINAFVLLKQSFGGSGYDIACAQNNTPITYQMTANLPLVHPVSFNPEFTNKIYFIYLNQKKDSKEAIANFKKKQKNLTTEVQEVSKQTDQLLQLTNFTAFTNLLTEYENNLSLVLETPTIQQQLFSDFNGVVKSLGGWGGDFVLVASETDPTAYFKAKGYKTILSYQDMIL
ncbi:GHMP kinase [Flavobacterium agricola]|uniref:GHMP kinase n=1 Tax=Flavobacterium agricola TaxID=2870839 RepID=A0ABY6M0S4_9FLAO|nr:GYDIA family GHMP kinase [Flavobacterium agricola]UYW01320.1 GHMP kinase [Flavobacterium agricola]